MKMPLKSRKSRAVFNLWLVELALICVAVTVAAWLRFYGDPETHLAFAKDAPLRTALVAFCTTGAMAAFGLYQVHARYRRVDLVLRLGISFIFGGVALLVMYYVVPRTYIGRGVLAMALTQAFLMLLLLRLWLQGVFDGDSFKRRVLVLGAGQTADLINRRLRRRSDRHSFRLVGFLPARGQPEVVDAGLLVRSDLDLVSLACEQGIHEIVVAVDERRGGMPTDQLLACAQRGIQVTDLPDFFEREAGMIKLNVVEPSVLIFGGGFDHSLPRQLSKRFFDLVAASALLLVAWPFMLLVVACVWLESGAPVLYRQVRVGESGKRFELVKFRSMRIDAEKDGVARWADANDDRTTRVGRFIRKTRLDELPQLFNVLRGDMSFVGPRPERPQFVDQFNREIRYYGIRHSVKPGLTGWAQLRYPYGASAADAEEKLKFDLFYVKNQGLVFDLMILLQTVEVVLFGRGAR
ncbi:TIGR03013 family PEP-CTERM/XrtA system glycosyltransferase [Luteimonas lutimaris]|uniref:TIGR03013 family PEP-CTERM/XrtA system glycosyltransferase n=2 Tax=Luteimonas lutimaris TaxID=698645 RepID=A0ABP7MHI9_9GAMM